MYVAKGKKHLNRKTLVQCFSSQNQLQTSGIRPKSSTKKNSPNSSKNKIYVLNITGVSLQQSFDNLTASCILW